MRAIVLAAGQGTRLRPITDDVPKCLVELEGVSLLERQVRTLQSAGINDITVVGGYRAEQLKERGYKVVVNENFATTNMVATLFCAREAIRGASDLIIAYGDIVYERRVLDAVCACSAPVCVAVDIEWRRYWELRFDDPLEDAETLKLATDGRILELGKKPSSYSEIEGQYIGLIKVRADVIDRLMHLYDSMDRSATYDGKSFENMYMTSFLQYLIDQGWDVRSVPIENGWLEVDRLSDLELYRELNRRDQINRYYRLE